LQQKARVIAKGYAECVFSTVNFPSGAYELNFFYEFYPHINKSYTIGVVELPLVASVEPSQCAVDRVCIVTVSGSQFAEDTGIVFASSSATTEFLSRDQILAVFSCTSIGNFSVFAYLSEASKPSDVFFECILAQPDNISSKYDAKKIEKLPSETLSVLPTATLITSIEPQGCF